MRKENDGPAVQVDHLVVLRNASTWCVGEAFVVFALKAGCSVILLLLHTSSHAYRPAEVEVEG